MKCPVCTGVDLKMSERQGVEIDYCPECRGVWLDRGELDKIIERSETKTATNTPPQPPPQYQQPVYNQQHHGKQEHDSHGYSQNGQYRKKSWISELFD
jgi:Zn-finger nucleic acid-binding protein